VKRGGPLKRKTELRAKPEKVRAFVQRGRASGARSLRTSAIAAARIERPREGPLDAASWRRAVFAASGGRCMITGARARDADDPRFHVHHPLPKGVLRARDLYAHVWDPRNGVWLSQRAHERHENATERIGWILLPASVWAFCREMDALDGTQWATMLVRRLHRVAGDGDELDL
jgi:hypothetical protein